MNRCAILGCPFETESSEAVPQTGALWDFLRFRPDLKPFLPTDMLHLLTTYHPAFSTQQHMDATVSVAWMRPGQGHDALMKLLLVGGADLGR